MAETDNTAKLVDQLRALAHGTLIDPDPQDVADDAVDLIEAQAARIAELESEVDAFQEQQNNLAALIPDEYDGDEYQGALIERFVRDAAGRFEQQVAERDALAVRIRRVEETSANHYRNALVWMEQAHALAAVIEKVRDGLSSLDLDSGSTTAPGTAWGSILREARNAFATAPSDILAEHDSRVLVEYEARRKPDPIHIDNIDSIHAATWIAKHDADLIHEAAVAIRAHATAPTELIYPNVLIDPLIAWVADWMENPPEWVKVSYRKKAGE